MKIDNQSAPTRRRIATGLKFVCETLNAVIKEVPGNVIDMDETDIAKDENDRLAGSIGGWYHYGRMKRAIEDGESVPVLRYCWIEPVFIGAETVELQLPAEGDDDNGLYYGRIKRMYDDGEVTFRDFDASRGEQMLALDLGFSENDAEVHSATDEMLNYFQARPELWGSKHAKTMFQDWDRPFEGWGRELKNLQDVVAYFEEVRARVETDLQSDESP